MHHLLESRRTIQGAQSPQKLANLSPEKYGKAAYVELTYTPSKLADNVLYRQVTTLKKLQQGNGKLREVQALNNHFQDRLNQIKEERDGIEDSLSSQIQMYKRLLHECEIKSEARIKEIQASFKEQIRILIEEKEEEAKYAQSEKEILQNRIEELESILAELRDKLNNKGADFDNLKNEKEKLDIKYENVCDKLRDTENKAKKDAEEAKQEYEKLSRKLYNAEVDFKNELENQNKKKQKEIETLERLQRNELEKVEKQREADKLRQNQELKDLTHAFESEGQRLNEIVNMKDRMIDNLNKENSKEKQRILDLTKNYENQINNLAHDKSRLMNEVDDLNRQNTGLNLRIRDNEMVFDRERQGLENGIDKLRDEVEFNQVNFIREKDRNVYLSGDFEKQLAHLRAENASLLNVVSQNQILSKEVRNLRQLLLESSHEMEKCKEEFLRLGKERDLLLLKIRDLGGQCDALHRIKYEKQEQARGWRQTYYMARPKY